MKYNILYTGIFLDNKSKKNLKNWFKIKKQKDLLDNICSDVAVLSTRKRVVTEDHLSSLDIGKEVDLEVVGFLDEDDLQMVLCSATSSGKKLVNKFLKIVVSTNYSKVNLSNFQEDDFIECNGPTLKGKIGYLNNKKEIILKLPNVYEDS